MALGECMCGELGRSPTHDESRMAMQALQIGVQDLAVAAEVKLAKLLGRISGDAPSGGRASPSVAPPAPPLDL